jgi:hypothetical protein
VVSKHNGRPLKFEPPPHPNAEAHQRVMKRLETMTTREFKASLVRSGILTRDGKLTAHYVDPADGE